LTKGTPAPVERRKSHLLHPQNSELPFFGTPELPIIGKLI
jgi:hypothetical protein